MIRVSWKSDPNSSSVEKGIVVGWIHDYGTYAIIVHKKKLIRVWINELTFESFVE